MTMDDMLGTTHRSRRWPLRPGGAAASLLAAAAVLGTPAAAQAHPVAGVLQDANVLVGFDSAAPGTFLSQHPITGLATPGERIVALDHRVAPLGPPEQRAARQGLYGVGLAADGATIRVYRIDPGSGAAAPVGGPSTAPAAGTRFGTDIDAATDRIRLVDDAGGNRRLDPETGATVGIDADLGPAPATITAIATSDPVDPFTEPRPATTTYAIDATSAKLGTLGGAASVPSPDGGAFSAVGPLGVTPDAGTPGELDITQVPCHGFCFPSPGPLAQATITSGGVQRLHTVDLATGAASEGRPTAAALAGFAFVPDAQLFLGRIAYGSPSSAPYARVAESAGVARVFLGRVGNTQATVPVRWETGLGQTGALTLAPGQTEAAIEIPVADDAVDEPDQDVRVRITSAGFPGRVMSEAGFTIVDDDPAPVVATPAPVVDRTPPALSLGRTPASMTYPALLRNGLKIRMTPDERVALRVTLLRPGYGRKPGAARVPVTTRSLSSSTRMRSVTLKPTTRSLRRPTRSTKLKVRVVATDGDGNRRTRVRTIVVRPR